MIISASRRTDIPCFYSDWFMNRINWGFVNTRNPMNPKQIKRVSLLPGDVDCFVFWTKDPHNMLDKLTMLETAGYAYYFQFTVTPYGRSIEKNLRDKTDIEDTLIELSKNIGKDRVVWRYDPIIINDQLTLAYHKNQFERLCERFHKSVNSVTISFADNYKKLKNGVVQDIEDNVMLELASLLSETAGRYELTAKSCCEKIDFTKHGIQTASCIDKNLIEKIINRPLAVKPDKNQREGCGCYASVDIGAYNTCRNGCVYCYANYSYDSVEKNIRLHDVNGEFLIGN